jgi:3-mercaptopyruvate sulfurtransferase SseA
MNISKLIKQLEKQKTLGVQEVNVIDNNWNDWDIEGVETDSSGGIALIQISQSDSYEEPDEEEEIYPEEIED